MSKRGMPGLVSGDIKAASPLSRGHKVLAQEMMPSRHAKAQLAGGDAVQRTMGNYAKLAPGVASMGPNINSMAKV
jgi:hypothetical protein